MEIDPLAQIGDILRGFVGDAGDVILINQHGGGAVQDGRDFLDINHGAVGDAAGRIQPSAAFVFDLVRILGFAAGGQSWLGHGDCSSASV